MPHNLTAVIAWSADSLLLAAFLLPLWMRNKSRRFALYWVLGLLAQAVGLALLTFTQYDRIFVIAMLAFTALICARSLSTAGLLCLYGEKRPALLTLAAIGIWCIGLVAGRLAGFDPRANVTSFYLSAFAVSLYGVCFLATLKKDNAVRFRRLLMGLFALEGLTCLVFILLYNIQPNRPVLGSATSSIALIVGFLLFSSKGFLAVWLTVERLERELRDLAFSDPLTNVLNRRGVLNEIEKMSHRSAKTDLFAYFSLDLDDFKSINDIHGHSAGDRALINFADVVRACLREKDIFGRTGGEEFAIFTRVADQSTAARIAERIRSSLEATSFHEAGQELKMTVSIGITLMRGRVGDIEAMLTEADRALYRAKGDGRNRIVFYDGSRAVHEISAGQDVALVT